MRELRLAASLVTKVVVVEGFRDCVGSFFVSRSMSTTQHDCRRFFYSGAAGGVGPLGEVGNKIKKIKKGGGGWGGRGLVAVWWIQPFNYAILPNAEK